MCIWQRVFSALVIIFGFIGLMELFSYDISLLIMFIFIGLAMLANAKECYDKGSKKDTMIFCGVAIFIYTLTACNLIIHLIIPIA